MRRAALLVAKLLAAAALLAVLLKTGRLELSALRLLRFDLRVAAWVIAATAAVAVGNAFSGLRLKALLANGGVEVTLGRAVGLAFAGTFLGYVLPGLVFGDAFKAVLLCRGAAQSKTRVVLLVLLDRAVGLFSFLLLSSVALLAGLAFGYVGRGLSYLLVAPALALGGITAAALVGTFGDRWVRSRRSTEEGGRISRSFRRGAEVLGELVRSPRVIALSLVCSLIDHMLIVCSYIIAARLIGAGLPLSSHFVLDPIAMIANAIPITPGGLGITESAFSLLYQTAGSADGAVVGLIGRLFQYAAYAIGGVAAIILLDAGNLVFARDRARAIGGSA